MRTRRIDFNYKPLNIQKSLVVLEGVPDKQIYDDSTGIYTPNYEIASLRLQPIVSVFDKDGIFPSGRVNANLTNIKWFKTEGGVRTQISKTDNSYNITDTGYNKGCLEIKKNSRPSMPVTFSFYADYIDPRTKQIYSIRDSHLVSCSVVSTSVHLKLDEKQSFYNPLVDSDIKTIKASVYVGKGLADKKKYSLGWLRKGGDGRWIRILNGNNENYEFNIIDDGIEVNRKLMGNICDIKCIVRYSFDGNIDTAPTVDETYCSLVRRIPKFDFDILDVPYNISPNIEYIYPRAYVQTAEGEIKNPERIFAINWYMSRNESNTPNYTLVADGEKPKILTNYISTENGGILGLDVFDKGSLSAASDTDGSILTDYDGSLILFN